MKKDSPSKLPKCPMEKRNDPELGVLYYYKHSIKIYENWLRNDDFIVRLVLFHIVSIVCRNIPKT